MNSKERLQVIYWGKFPQIQRYGLGIVSTGIFPYGCWLVKPNSCSQQILQGFKRRKKFRHCQAGPSKRQWILAYNIFLRDKALGHTLLFTVRLCGTEIHLSFYVMVAEPLFLWLKCLSLQALHWTDWTALGYNGWRTQRKYIYQECIVIRHTRQGTDNRIILGWRFAFPEGNRSACNVAQKKKKKIVLKF